MFFEPYLSQWSFVIRVGVTINQGDGHRSDLFLWEPPGENSCLIKIERHDDFSDRHHVGEGSPGVNADSNAHVPVLQPLFGGGF